ENASYPLCMCAERVALYAASSQHPGKIVKKLAVVAHKKNHKELTGAAPCGACRQVMLEYEQKQKSAIEIVIFADENKWAKSSAADDLLPMSFDSSKLL
ncbi:MAG TPA: hypothetical protein VG737_09750, partial [Cyclobacteriaceae bacterium]|nr:hypothetical protein [Cyclobacteriaceae bacterium]